MTKVLRPSLGIFRDAQEDSGASRWWWTRRNDEKERLSENVTKSRFGQNLNAHQTFPSEFLSMLSIVSTSWLGCPGRLWWEVCLFVQQLDRSLEWAAWGGRRGGSPEVQCPEVSSAAEPCTVSLAGLFCESFVFPASWFLALWRSDCTKSSKLP